MIFNKDQQLEWDRTVAALDCLDKLICELMEVKPAKGTPELVHWELQLWETQRWAISVGARRIKLCQQYWANLRNPKI